jgi:tRNA A37 methylthiotransferase MiaB
MIEEPVIETFYISCKKNCPRRVLEASRNYRYFIKNGLQPVDNPKNANLILVHSCGGFKLSEEASILTLEKVLNVKSKSSKVIMTGCLPKINKKALSPYDGVLIIPTEDLATSLDSLIHAKTPYNSIPESSIIEDVNDLYYGTFIKRTKRNLGLLRAIGFNRRLLKAFKRFLRRNLFHVTINTYFREETYKLVTSEGCVGECTYCAIRFAMPVFHSIPEEQIIENFRVGLNHNYKNFALTGADIGAYGIDMHTNLPNLLEKLFAVEGDYKLTLVDLNARWFTKYYKELLFVLENNAEKVSKIILPIQSGSDRILRLMRRHYSIDDVKKCILDLQKNIPTSPLETHIMVGFPGETEEDFQMSLQLLKDVHFSKVDIYKYEDRPRTVASKMTNKIPDAIINKRVKKLLANATSEAVCVN